MAIQDRNGKIRGKINNIVYRRLGGQQILQIAPDRVKQTYATKLSALEFGLASAHGKVIRQIFQMVYEQPDGKMANRLNTAIAACLRSSNKQMGERSLHDTDLGCLKGFQFNLNAPIENRIAVRPVWKVGPDGLFRFRLPSFNPVSDISYPPGKVRMDPTFTIGLIAVQFEKEYMQVVDYESFAYENIDRQFQIDWECRRLLPAGAIVMAVFALRYSTVNWVGKQIWTTDHNFSPTIILDAFHVTEDMAARGKAANYAAPEKKADSFGYNVPRILKKIAEFKEKNVKNKK